MRRAFGCTTPTIYSVLQQAATTLLQDAHLVVHHPPGATILSTAATLLQQRQWLASLPVATEGHDAVDAPVKRPRGRPRKHPLGLEGV